MPKGFYQYPLECQCRAGCQQPAEACQGQIAHEPRMATLLCEHSSSGHCLRVCSSHAFDAGPGRTLRELDSSRSKCLTERRNDTTGATPSYNRLMSQSKPVTPLLATLGTGLFLASLASLFIPTARPIGIVVLFCMYLALSIRFKLYRQHWNWAFWKTRERR